MRDAGAIQTEVTEQIAEREGKSLPDLMAELAQDHAMKRVGQPEEIAAPVVFLASNAGERQYSESQQRGYASLAVVYRYCCVVNAAAGCM